MSYKQLKFYLCFLILLPIIQIAIFTGCEGCNNTSKSSCGTQRCEAGVIVFNSCYREGKSTKQNTVIITDDNGKAIPCM